jgi:hypothetical protein
MSDVLLIGGYFNEANESLTSVSDIALIYAELTSASDRAFVRDVLKKSIKHSAYAVRSDAKQINETWPSLRSPAAANEGGRLRDGLNQAADLLDKFAAKMPALHAYIGCCQALRRR